MPGRCQDPPLERCRGEHFVRVSENGTRKAQERAAAPNKPKTRSGGGSASTAASIEADAALYRAKVDELRSQIDEEALHALDFNPASKDTV